MKVVAKIKNLRIAPRKVRLIAKLINGLGVDDAFVQLENNIKRSSLEIEKLLKSAVANAENNWGLDRNNLYILSVKVGEGSKMKRWMPRAYGRATQILKRSSNVELVLAEIVEGKNRKSKEQLIEERKKREDEKEKLKKDIEAKRSSSSDKEKTETSFREKKTESDRGKGEKKGWMKKIFQRKAG